MTAALVVVVMSGCLALYVLLGVLRDGHRRRRDDDPPEGTP